MDNPFYIQPASPLPGIKEFNNRLEFERGRTEDARKKEVRKKVSDIIKNGNPEEIAEIVTNEPWVTGEIDKGNALLKDISLENAKRILSGEISPGQGFINIAEEEAKNGQDISKAIPKIKDAQRDPESAKAWAEKYIALHDPDAWKEYRKSQGKTEEEKPPSGYRYKEDGTLEAIPGGPATGERAPKGYYWEEKNKLAPIPGGPADKKNKSDESSLEIGYRTYLSANNKQNSPESYAAYQKNQAAQKKEMQKATVTRPYMAELMSQGYIPSTRVTGPMLDAYEAAAAKAAENGKPLTVEDLRDMEFQAVKNRATGQSAGSRLTVQRKQNIEAAYGLLDDLKATSKKLDYSPARFVAEIDRFIKGQSNDPILTEYMTQRADALFVLGNALKQNGLTDKSIEVEEEAATPTLSPQAFEAWYNTQLRALNRAAKEMNTDYKYGIPTVPTVPAGKGGAGPATDTGGTPPAAGWSIKRVE